ncbi:MAG: T9SS type A sorting domain-containing protein, partial [Ignavibacteriales bacterium]|nr:T9SS type A sorting domain-containing protein [Ignavibacteriales bacterium]
YPNPFNPTTAIGFSLLAVSNVTLKVFDILGKEVATLIHSRVMDEGKHEVEFDASNLPSGVYFYRLYVTQQGLLRYSETKKLLLMK